MTLPISGLNISLQSGTNKIDIGAGGARDTGDDVSIVVPSGEVRTIDPATTGPNGLDTGSLAADSRYSVWVISGGGQVAGLMSLSFAEGGVTWPSAGTKRRRVGTVITDSSGDIQSFVQTGGSNDRTVTWQLDLLDKLVVHNEDEGAWKFREMERLVGPLADATLMLLKPSPGTLLHIRQASSGGGPLISVSSETTWQFVPTTGADRMEFRTSNGPGSVYVLGFQETV